MHKHLNKKVNKDSKTSNIELSFIFHLAVKLEINKQRSQIQKLFYCNKKNKI